MGRGRDRGWYLTLGGHLGSDVRPVVDAPGWWRPRIGNLRALLQVEKERKRLVFARLSPRGDICKS